MQNHQSEKLIIIDANSIIHRAYHALPKLTTKDGKLVNAVYGFLLVFLKAINDFGPDFLAVAFDLPAPTFRHKIYKDYKAQRPKTPQDLSSQIPTIKDILKVFGVSIFEKEGYEADDIIATIATKEGLSGISKIILSGDSDILQLVDKNTGAHLLRRGVKDIQPYDENAVKEKFQGLFPNQLLDFKALRGDASDNIPGVFGIGEKTATELLLEFKTLENIYDKIKKNEMKNVKPRIRGSLIREEKNAFLSKKLGRLAKDVPIEFDLQECRWGNYKKEDVQKILENLEFYSLIKRLPENKVSLGTNLKLW